MSFLAFHSAPAANASLRALTRSSSSEAETERLGRRSSEQLLVAAAALDREEAAASRSGSGDSESSSARADGGRRNASVDYAALHSGVLLDAAGNDITGASLSRPTSAASDADSSSLSGGKRLGKRGAPSPRATKRGRPSRADIAGKQALQMNCVVVSAPPRSVLCAPVCKLWR